MAAGRSPRPRADLDRPDRARRAQAAPGHGGHAVGARHAPGERGRPDERPDVARAEPQGPRRRAGRLAGSPGAREGRGERRPGVGRVGCGRFPLEPAQRVVHSAALEAAEVAPGPGFAPRGAARVVHVARSPLVASRCRSSGRAAHGGPGLSDPVGMVPASGEDMSVFAALRRGWASLPKLHREGPYSCSGEALALPRGHQLFLSGVDWAILGIAGAPWAASASPFAISTLAVGGGGVLTLT